jgi:hypothetical protein
MCIGELDVFKINLQLQVISFTYSLIYRCVYFQMYEDIKGTMMYTGVLQLVSKYMERSERFNVDWTFILCLKFI